MNRLPVVVLISGTGSNLAALLDASRTDTTRTDTSRTDTTRADTSGAAESPYRVVAVIADRDAPGLEHARAAEIPTQIVRLSDFPDRASWDEALTEAVRAHDPRLVVLAGFMKLVGPPLLEAFGGRIINTHPALLPSFPGAHGVRDALAHGVKVTGCSVIEVDAGVDTGRILAQVAVDVLEEDTEATLHERIKAVEQPLLVDVVRRLTAAG